MKFNRKSLISWLLVLSVLFGMLSMQVMAAETTETKVAEQQVLLGDDLTMRFLVSIEDAYKGAVMNITVAGNTYGTYNISEMTEEGYAVSVNGKPAVTVPMMTKTVYGQLMEIGEKYFVTVGEEVFETEITQQSTVIGTQSTGGMGFGRGQRVR